MPEARRVTRAVGINQLKPLFDSYAKVKVLPAVVDARSKK